MSTSNIYQEGQGQLYKLRMSTDRETQIEENGRHF